MDHWRKAKRGEKGNESGREEGLHELEILSKGPRSGGLSRVGDLGMANPI